MIPSHLSDWLRRSSSPARRRHLALGLGVTFPLLAASNLLPLAGCRSLPSSSQPVLPSEQSTGASRWWPQWKWPEVPKITTPTFSQKSPSSQRWGLGSGPWSREEAIAEVPAQAPSSDSTRSTLADRFAESGKGISLGEGWKRWISTPADRSNTFAEGPSLSTPPTPYPSASDNLKADRRTRGSSSDQEPQESRAWEENAPASSSPWTRRLPPATPTEPSTSRPAPAGDIQWLPPESERPSDRSEGGIPLSQQSGIRSRLEQANSWVQTVAWSERTRRGLLERRRSEGNMLPAIRSPEAQTTESDPPDGDRVPSGRLIAEEKPVRTEKSKTVVGAQPEASATPQPNKSNSGTAGKVAPEEKEQVLAEGWSEPWVALVVTGDQFGYLEPCGCTGLANQKGGLIRRDTLLQQIRGKGWNVVPLDAGNQVRRPGRQSELKFARTAEALKLMGYQAVGLGPDDLNLSATDLLLSFSDIDPKQKSPFVSANVVVYEESFLETLKILSIGDRKIGVTAFLGVEESKQVQNVDVSLVDPVEPVAKAARQMEEMGVRFKVLIAHASLEESAQVAKAVPKFDLVITSGGFGEPTYKPEAIEGTPSQMVQVGVKGMYAGLIGLYDDPNQPLRYQRIALTDQFPDSQRITELFQRYQEELQLTGLEGLGLRPLMHSSNRRFVGSEKCGECHTEAFEIWKGTPHSHATDSIVHPPERSEIARHFDPECLSCHVTGWNPQKYYPYTSGFLGLETSRHLVGNGCENCHGPGAEHSAAEEGSSSADPTMLTRLREEMKLPLERARDKCLECHDLDNSPDFHQDGAFEKYWNQVKHYGKD